MNKVILSLVTGLMLVYGFTINAAGETGMKSAKGEFQITLTPQDDGVHGAGRLTFDKTFTGDLVGTSVGQMLSHRSATAGSAGYVAIETLSVTLDGKKGGFVLMHSGTMQSDNQQQEISIVPDSGTDDLKGITGTFAITVKDGKHFYELSYSVRE